MKISVAIITLNAAADLDRCLQSVAFADEIIVLDQGSSDNTDEVCARHGAALHQTQWLGFGPTKQKAVDLCRNRWVLSIDSDEQVTPELQAAIEALPDQPDEAAFMANRLSRFLGKWIRHCGWHPEYVTRLFDCERARFNDKPVHEAVVTTGAVGRLDGLMLHYTYETMEQYIDKLNRYTTLAAEELHAQGRRAGLFGAVVRAKAAFLRMWLLKGGILDGLPGTVLCMASGFYVLSKYTKLWRMGRR
ncbi:MAG: glycosyltransferase family 2 protein [Candidatus Krumholzibacteriota bacterium]